MCLTVYIASEHELPSVPWNENSPDFSVIVPSDYPEVEKCFSLPNVAYVGSHQGCGCGFSRDGVYAGKELEEVDNNYRRLADYIESLQANGAGGVELYCFWDGELGPNPESDKTISVSDLLAPEFEIKMNTFYRIAFQ